MPSYDRLHLYSLTYTSCLSSLLILLSSTNHQLNCPALRCCPALPPSLLALTGSGTAHLQSAGLLLQHESSPLLQFCCRCFQACFSHSCWFSQPKLHEQTSIQGVVPCALAGVLTLHMTGEGPLGLSTPQIIQLRSDSCSQGNILYLKVMSWEEPAPLARLIFSLSGWHKPHHYGCSFYLLDLENPKLISHQPVFMFCSLAGYEIFL